MHAAIRALISVVAATLLTFSVANASDLSATLAKAKEGDIGAMHNVGVAYANGEVVEQDYGRAMQWFEMAAKKGQHNSMYSLAVMHKLGQGVPVDLVKAYAWHSLAAEFIPKDADEWFIPRAKVAMYLRRPGEVARQLSDTELRQAEELRKELRKRIGDPRQVETGR
ncbi:MAG: tetratricopeptide repeat protein [Rhodocyclaceae bacterium]